jgi:UDP-N-acetylglucosamine diphosphorylase / glucose-1-phosphate thymidylyltransferase / UDP-N-acetylgalactosamine diphosphorylase / glucosamine-1-phosphate N-acetyltransferase / galactosamine-1-phosphate N-acetyltransferase
MEAVVIFEDEKWVNFKPLTWTRPVCLLRTGIFHLWEKVVQACKRAGMQDFEVHIHTRNYIAPTLRHCLKGKGVFVNELERVEGKSVLFVNGRLLVTPELAQQASAIEKGVAYTKDGEPIAVYLGETATATVLPALQKGEPLTGSDLQALMDAATMKREVPEATLLRYPWQLIDHNAELISAEFPLATEGKESEGKLEQGAVIYGGDSSKVYLGKGAVVHPTVVLDVTHGPIFIGDNTIVYPPTRIEGPAYIGKGTWIVGGKIREGSNIGDVCRVGGEVEESIIHGYSNKYHDGFLGHAYVGEWVNLGALTTNSDLKDTYGSVRINIEGEGKIDAGTKVGCFIGDQVKTSIGVLIYTGKRIGIFSHVHGVATDDVPSFTIWAKSVGAPGDAVELLLESALEIHKRVLARRKIEATPEELELIRTLFELTREERERAGVRQGRPSI